MSEDKITIASVLAALESVKARADEMREAEQRIKAIAADHGLRVTPTFNGLAVNGGPMAMAKLTAAIDLHNLAASHKRK